MRDCVYKTPKRDVYIARAHYHNRPVFSGAKTERPNFLIDNFKVEGEFDNIYIFNGPITEGLPIAEEVFPDGTINQNPVNLNSSVKIINNKEGYTFLPANDEYVASFVNVEYI